MKDQKEEVENQLNDEEDIELLLEEANNFGLRWEIDNTAKVIKNIKKGGVNILSYFIQGEYNNHKYDAENNFKKMYGKDASFINIDNINEITKTLNKLLLKKELIS